MHLNGVSNKRLAEYMGITPEYVSMVLNGHREPDGAEQKFIAALQELIQGQNQRSKETDQ